MQDTIRVVLADDHPLIRAGLKARLLEEPGITVVGEVSSGESVLLTCEERRPEVLVLDLNMPGPPATAITETMGSQLPEVKKGCPFSFWSNVFPLCVPDEITVSPAGALTVSRNGAKSAPRGA